MDTTVSRMIKLIGALLVTGFVTCGILSAQAADFGNALGFMWGGLAAAALFTVIWAITSYQMAELLGKRKRSEITSESIIGLSIAFLALMSALGFVAAAIAAAAGEPGSWGEAHKFLWSGNASGGILTIIWCVSEYNFVQRAK